LDEKISSFFTAAADARSLYVHNSGHIPERESGEKKEGTRKKEVHKK
jgi:hypothetical protein